MLQRVLVLWASDFPQIVLFLFCLLVADVVFLFWREHRRAIRGIPDALQAALDDRVEALTADLRTAGDSAQAQLTALAGLHTAARREAADLQNHVAGSRAEAERMLEEVRGLHQQMAALVPSQEELQWVSPSSLIRLALQAEDWRAAAGYLARLNPEHATSRNLEAAADICRDQGYFTKALEFYRLAAARDPENLTAQSELLALSATTIAAERNAALGRLQELVAQSFSHGMNGTVVQNRWFETLTALGRYRELAAFCEEQLKKPLPPAAQGTLHRNLAHVCSVLGRNDEALEHGESALRLLGDDGALLSVCARLLFTAGRFDEAYRIALRALHREPTVARNYMVLAEIQEKRAGRSAARVLLERAVQWAEAGDMCAIEDRLRRLSALDELSEVLPSTRPQIIQA